MSLERLMNDRVSLVEPDGERVDDIPARVSSDLIIVLRDDLAIEEGDMIERALPGGSSEAFEVIDRGFQSGFGGIRSHFQIKVRRKGQLGTGVPGSINVSGPNARLNVNSQDFSTNSVVSEDQEKLFQRLREAVDSISEATIRRRLLALVEEMKSTSGSGEFASAYQKFVAGAANHMNLLAPFLPLLTKLLSP